MILGGDLGGTKTLLALAEVVGGRIEIVRQQRYASADFASFDDLLTDFLTDRPTISAASFGVAGPTDGRDAKLTYLPWQLRASELESRFAIGQVALLNDFAAAAHGLPWVDDHDVLTLQAGCPEPGAARVILGAGTGLGVAGLIRESHGYRVIPGEGGHFGFAPQTEEQGKLWHHLRKEYGRVTIEDVVSGPGLSRIFAFFSGRPWEPAEIGQAALDRSNPHAVAALRLWLECYGAFAGDLAMHWLAHGGVYLAGGIAAKLLPHIDATPFLAAFLDKREHRDLVKKMPIRLLTVEDLGLRGALAFAAG